MVPKPEMGKYLLYQFFCRDNIIRKYLPPTRRYTPENLKSFLKQYQMIYVKPVAGARGRGIMKVWRTNGMIFVQKTIQGARTFGSIQDAIRYIDQEREGKAYIVQKGLRLAGVKGLPFDIRVMMQRECPGGSWLFSGMIAKIAGKGSVVTNVALSRGTVMQVPEALSKSLGWSRERCDRCIKELTELGFRAAKHFDNYQPYRELGFDLAVDESGRIWLIEQNTGPSHPLFKHLKNDLTMYRRIQYRWAQYQRALLRQKELPGKKSRT